MECSRRRIQLQHRQSLVLASVLIKGQDKCFERFERFERFESMIGPL